MEEIDLNKENMYKDEEFTRELAKRFSTKERSEMRMCSLDNYSLFIASRYLETVDDHINLVKISKRMEHNMDKFHYNPISVDDVIVQFFPNIQTLHVYEEEDEYIKVGRICQYVDWIIKEYYESEKIKEANKEKEIEFKKIIWTPNDNRKEYRKQRPNNYEDDYYDSEEEEERSIEINIPEGVNEIEAKCFENFYDLGKLTIPSTVTSIPKKLFYNCDIFTNITLPLNQNQVIYGNKIYKNSSHLEQYVELPDSIKIINVKEV